MWLNDISLDREHSETITQYVAVLRELAIGCEFGIMEDQMQLDQLVEHVVNSRIHTLLEHKPDS